eukprot:GFYU01008436.1.p1 GENE.GFYU01008436.1~~GFYU01008436.1.p1  ORF type:complete len:231 (-),score=43.65 GFYU01008436.1:454-1050(-)
MFNAGKTKAMSLLLGGGVAGYAFNNYFGRNEDRSSFTNAPGSNPLSPISETHCGSRHEERIGEFAASGMFFKDMVEVRAIPDPKVDGVTVHVSTIKDARLTPRFWFNDPSSASISVAQTGDIKFLSKIDTSTSGEDIFSESRNLLFKQLRVRRVYDETNNTLVYVSYTSKLTSDEKTPGSQYKTSCCAVPLGKTIKPE